VSKEAEAIHDLRTDLKEFRSLLNRLVIAVEKLAERKDENVTQK
jgi:hypothetical protein